MWSGVPWAGARPQPPPGCPRTRRGGSAAASFECSDSARRRQGKEEGGHVSRRVQATGGCRRGRTQRPHLGEQVLWAVPDEHLGLGPVLLIGDCAQVLAQQQQQWGGSLGPSARAHSAAPPRPLPAPCPPPAPTPARARTWVSRCTTHSWWKGASPHFVQLAACAGDKGGRRLGVGGRRPQLRAPPPRTADVLDARFHALVTECAGAHET